MIVEIYERHRLHRWWSSTWAMTVLGYLAKLILGVLGSSQNCSIFILLLLSSGFCNCWGNDDWLEDGFYYDPSYDLCATAFAYFAQATVAQEIFGHTLQSLRGIKYLYKRRCEQWPRVRSSDIGNKISSNYYTALRTVIHVQDHEFIRSIISGFSRVSLFSWLNHCSGNPKFNFYKYMTRALENDFKKVVGIRCRMGVKKKIADEAIAELGRVTASHSAYLANPSNQVAVAGNFAYYMAIADAEDHGIELSWWPADVSLIRPRNEDENEEDDVDEEGNEGEREPVN
ncbi:hypothetical protein ACS0TY_033005 [Phlomoides rotata]